MILFQKSYNLKKCCQMLYVSFGTMLIARKGVSIFFGLKGEIVNYGVIIKDYNKEKT